MRKLITSFVLILLFSLFSGAVFAGDKGVCDENKKALQKAGVYGLCVAYQNADDADKPAIAAKFRERFGDDVPGFIPVSFPDPDPKPGQDFYCPCFARVSFADICSYGVPSAEFATIGGAIQGGFVFFSLANGESVLFDTIEANCSYGHFDVDFLPIDEEYRSAEQGTPLMDDEPFACRADLEAIGTITADDCAAMGY